MLGSLSLPAVDDYADGKLDMSLLGLPLQRQSGPETVSGQALR